MKAYNEPLKNKARRLVIDEAIKTLTLDRANSTLARRSYVRDVRDHFIKTKHHGIAQAAALSDATITRWEEFFDSVTQSKQPANLKVAYLSGPNPENDLREFCNAGLLPENIWAFESEKDTYLKGVESALASEFPFIKMIHSGIDAFFEASPQRFDIIYLDFCGPLPSKNQKTLGTITQLFARHSLNSPGILITNVALPTEENDSVGRELLCKLVSCYLYPKSFLESTQCKSNFTDGAIALGFDHIKWIKNIRENMDNYYGQFVTRLLMDHASFISPYDRFPTHNSIFKRFFKIDDEQHLQALITNLFHFSDVGEGGDVIVDAGLSPILWTLAALDKQLNAQDINYPQYIHNDEGFQKFSELFLRQLNTKNNQKDLVRNIGRMSYLLSEGNKQSDFLSDHMQMLLSRHSFRHFYPFCDMVLFHQILELLFRQVACPYHVNIEKTRRWRYQAKNTPMYMDMLVLDECRYLYDWMPTSDMISNGMTDDQRQLSYRFALDGVSKHRRWYNPEYFSGTAVVDQYTKGFEAKILKPRVQIS